MKKELTRRDLISRAGLLLGGAATLGVLQGCGDEDAPCPVPQECPPVTDNAAPLKQFPYQQHLDPAYRLVVDAVTEAAYHGYYAGGCCHGAYNGLMKHLADTAGSPFDLLPLDFGMFGGGGVAGYGSICGAVLGGVLTINFVVPNVANTDAAKANVRARMMTELMRWYEGFAFPAYTPDQVDAKETGLTLGFNDSTLPAVVALAPRTHLCHGSVSGWCAANANVGTNSGDKKARCARLTADVAGKVAEMLNAYLETGAFTPAEAASAENAACTSCHTNDGKTTSSGVAPPVASGMECDACHTPATHALPQTHVVQTTETCAGCHP